MSDNNHDQFDPTALLDALSAIAAASERALQIALDDLEIQYELLCGEHKSAHDIGLCSPSEKCDDFFVKNALPFLVAKRAIETTLATRATITARAKVVALFFPFPEEEGQEDESS